MIELPVCQWRRPTQREGWFSCRCPRLVVTGPVPAELCRGCYVPGLGDEGQPTAEELEAFGPEPLIRRPCQHWPDAKPVTAVQRIALGLALNKTWGMCPKGHGPVARCECVERTNCPDFAPSEEV